MPWGVRLAAAIALLFLGLAGVISAYGPEDRPTWSWRQPITSTRAVLARIGDGTEYDGLITQFLPPALMGPVALLLSGALLASLAGGTLGNVGDVAVTEYIEVMERQDGLNAILEEWGALLISLVGTPTFLVFAFFAAQQRAVFGVVVCLGLTIVFGVCFLANLQLLGITDGPFSWVPGESRPISPGSPTNGRG